MTAPFASTTRWWPRTQWTRRGRNSSWRRRILRLGKRTRRRRACWRRWRQLPGIVRRRSCCWNCRDHQSRTEREWMASVSELNTDAVELQRRIERFHAVREGILKQVRQVIVGQQDVLEQMLIALFVGGHCLVTGMPGTAKTLMVRTLADSLGLRFRRIQFTPDLMPSDITGTDIIEEDVTTGHRKWTFVEGPIFGNVILADEINRTPRKTQAALLEAMQERSSTVRGHIYRLPSPFFVLATQNPIELEGTYPLPEAQLDRFLLTPLLGDRSAADEMRVIDRTKPTCETKAEAVTSAEELLYFQQL